MTNQSVRPLYYTRPRAVVIVCGMDEATADRYEARNDALRSIARRHGANEQRENMV